MVLTSTGSGGHWAESAMSQRKHGMMSYVLPWVTCLHAMVNCTPSYYKRSL